jgi:hypothetical protein
LTLLIDAEGRVANEERGAGDGRTAKDEQIADDGPAVQRSPVVVPLPDRPTRCGCPARR